MDFRTKKEMLGKTIAITKFCDHIIAQCKKKENLGQVLS